MKILICNIIDLIGSVDAIGISTNGFVKKSGEAVMGRGIAKQIADLDPTIPKKLGYMIKRYSNCTQEICTINGTKIISIPVKTTKKTMTSTNDIVSHMKDQFKIGDIIPGWACKAELSIISKSLKELKQIMIRDNIEKIYLPLLGCGAGELKWKDIKELLEMKDNIIYERCIFCSYKKQDFE